MVVAIYRVQSSNRILLDMLRGIDLAHLGSRCHGNWGQGLYMLVTFLDHKRIAIVSLCFTHFDFWTFLRDQFFVTSHCLVLLFDRRVELDIRLTTNVPHLGIYGGPWTSPLRRLVLCAESHIVGVRHDILDCSIHLLNDAKRGLVGPFVEKVLRLRGLGLADWISFCFIHGGHRHLEHQLLSLLVRDQVYVL